MTWGYRPPTAAGFEPVRPASAPPDPPAAPAPAGGDGPVDRDVTEAPAGADIDADRDTIDRAGTAPVAPDGPAPRGPGGVAGPAPAGEPIAGAGFGADSPIVGTPPSGPPSGPVARVGTAWSPRLPPRRRGSGRAPLVAITIIGGLIALQVLARERREDSVDEPVPAPFVTFDVTPDTIVAPTTGFDPGSGPATGPTLTLGDSADLGPFRVRVTGADLAADERIAATNQFNEPAPTGSRFVLVDLQLENRSGTATYHAAELRYTLVGADGTRADSFNARVLPTPLPFDSTEAGATAAGQLSFIVPVGAEPLTLEIAAWDDITAAPAVWALG